MDIAFTDVSNKSNLINYKPFVILIQLSQTVQKLLFFITFRIAKKDGHNRLRMIYVHCGI